MRTITVLTIITMVVTSTITSGSGELHGSVCVDEIITYENYNISIMKNVTVRNYKWCLNVPPRCSYYTTKLVKEYIEYPVPQMTSIERCCNGSKEDDGRCIPLCGLCFKGQCEGDQCICDPGFRGNWCDNRCDQNINWGSNCTNNCTCVKGECDATTGFCFCHKGWTGAHCTLPCKINYWGRCSRKMSTSNTSSGTTDATTAVFANTTVRTKDTTKYFSSTTSEATTTEIFDNLTKITAKTNGKFKTSVTEKGILTVNHDILQNNNSGVTGKEFEEYKAKEVEVFEIPSSSTTNNNISISSSNIMKSSKEKVNNIESNLTSESSLNYQIKEDASYMNNEIIEDNEENDNNGLIYTVSVIFAVSVTIIILAVVVIFAQHFKKTERKLKANTAQVTGNKRVPSVSVYTTSIFHTPLPEPPTIENPVFSPSAENTNEILEPSLNYSNTKDVNSKEYLYDHPPSTGSYRAASIPEPPEQYQLNMQSIPEPLYDEIPSRLMPVVAQPPPSYKSLSLYMNTCGKTHF